MSYSFTICNSNIKESPNNDLDDSNSFGNIQHAILNVPFYFIKVSLTHS